MTHIGKIIVLVGMLFLMSGREVEAATESRCNALGTNCVCSSPLTGALSALSNFRYFLNDSGKPCAAEGIPGASFVRNTNNSNGSNKLVGDLYSTSEATIMNALPAGKTITQVVRAPDGFVSQIAIDHHDTALSTGRQRVAARWYQYISSNFEFAYDNTQACTNGKLASINKTSYDGDILKATFTSNSLSFYNFLGWQPAPFDCCFIGPRPSNDAGPTWPEYKGNWWRFEVVVTGLSGPGARVITYAKNVTDNLPERVVLDTAGTVGNGPGNVSWTARTNWVLPGPLNGIAVEPYRAGTCRGYQAWTHYMVASWTTDSGQRIGAAAEIEGGGGDTVPPAAPRLTLQ